MIEEEAGSVDEIVESNRIVCAQIREHLDKVDELMKDAHNKEVRHHIAARLLAIARHITNGAPDWALEHIGLRRIPVDAETEAQQTNEDTTSTNANVDSTSGASNDHPEPPDSGFAM